MLKIKSKPTQGKKTMSCVELNIIQKIAQHLAENRFIDMSAECGASDESVPNRFPVFS